MVRFIGKVVSGVRSGGCWAAGLVVVSLSVIVHMFPAETEPTRYVTTPFLEPDRCATAWVVHRYVDPKARFEFFERGEIPEEGVILYDLPEAELKRDARRATVEVLIEREQLDDPLVLRLGKIIHDIEINAWARRRVPGSLAFQQRLMGAIQAQPTTSSGLTVCFEMLDHLAEVGGDLERWCESRP